MKLKMKQKWSKITLNIDAGKSLKKGGFLEGPGESAGVPGAIKSTRFPSEDYLQRTKTEHGLLKGASPTCADAPCAEKGGKLEGKSKVECKKWSAKAECKGRVQRQILAGSNFSLKYYLSAYGKVPHVAAERGFRRWRFQRLFCGCVRI